MGTLSVVQAFDRARIDDIATDHADDLEAKLAAAANAFADRDSWLPAHQRGAVLQQTASLLQARQDHFAKIIAQEGGKPLKDATVEVVRAIDGLRNAAEELRHFAGHEIPMGLSAASDHRWAFTTREPIGVVAAISAFNHPLNLIVHQVAPAVATGCPVIIKPSAMTPLSCLALVALLREAGLPKTWCQTFITAENALAERLATDPRVAFLSFIGSAAVGWRLRSQLPPGTRCALEHGGAAPVLIDASTPLDAVSESLAKGGYYHAGQVCVSVQRIFVHADILPQFVDTFATRVAALEVGDPTRPSTDVGPLIHPREASRVATWIDEAVQAGARCLGGGRLSETTLRPSIVLEPPPDAKVSRLEIFGPVTCIYRFTNLDEAICRANALPYAFQASIFSSNLHTTLRAAQRLNAAAVMVNDHTAFRTDWMPFAGRGISGYGTGGIPYSMADMSHTKMIVMPRP